MASDDEFDHDDLEESTERVSRLIYISTQDPTES